MKKAFVSIYVLIILLVFGLTITFIYRENQTNLDSVESLTNKKIAMYEAESFINIWIEERNNENPMTTEDILDNFDHRSKIKMKVDKSSNPELIEAKVISATANYKNCLGHAILTYEEYGNQKIKIIYKRVYWYCQKIN